MKLLFILLSLSCSVIAERTNIDQITTEFTEHNANFNPPRNRDENIINEVLNPTNSEVLANIDDIESTGIQKRQEQNYFNLLEVDYSKPGAQKHKQEIDQIVSDTGSKLKDLTEFLRKNGIDCEPITQSNKQDFPFYIDSETLPRKEVKYKATFCEQLQNQYNCKQYLRIHCLIRSIQWNEWESRTIRVPGVELMNSRPNGLFAEHVAARIFEQKLFLPGRFRSLNSVPGVKSFLARKLNCSEENISNSMTFSWEGGVTHLGGKDYLWNTYVINYKYRDGKYICEKWSEEKWEEFCSFG